MEISEAPNLQEHLTKQETLTQEEKDAILPIEDKGIISAGLEKLSQQFLDRDLPKIIVLADTSARALAPAIQVVFQELAQIKGQEAPKIVFFKTRKDILARNLFEYQDNYDELEKNFGQIRTPDYRQASKDYAEAAFDVYHMMYRANEILQGAGVEDPNQILIVDDYIASSSAKTISAIRSSFGNPEIPAFCFLINEVSDIENAQSQNILIGAVDPYADYDVDHNYFYASPGFRFKLLERSPRQRLDKEDVTGVRKEEPGRFVTKAPGVIPEVKKWFHQELKKIGSVVAERIRTANWTTKGLDAAATRIQLATDNRIYYGDDLSEVEETPDIDEVDNALYEYRTQLAILGQAVD